VIYNRFSAAHSKCKKLQKEGHEGNVFLMRDEANWWKKGQTVKFTAYLSEEGKVRGKNLRSGLKVVDRDMSGGVLGDYVGTITSMGFKYGFIECDELSVHGGKALLIWDEYKSYKKGNKVRFTAYLTGDNKLQAKNLRSGLKEPVVEKRFNNSVLAKKVVKKMGLKQGSKTR